jgi:hypothetical protein
MEEIFYNILWIDDEHETLMGTKGRAKRNGINLIPFKSLNSGMDELEKNYPFYDGVIFDAKFFENEDDIKGTEDTYNVHRAKERLLQIKKKFEVFILTGQAEAYEDKTFKKAFTKVYKKGSDKEIDRLFSDVILSASTQEDTQLRHRHKKVFDVCTEKYLGELAGQEILNLLKSNDKASLDDNFNDIRKVVEDLFVAFNKFSLLPSEFITPSISLNEGSRFLAGKAADDIFFIEKGFKHLEGTHLPKLIVKHLRSVLSVTQAGSHRSDVDFHVKTIKTPYLFNSVFFQLLDLVVWFKMYVDTNPRTGNWERMESANSNKKPVSTELVTGKVIEKESLARRGKDFAFFKPDTLGDNILIPSHLVSSHSLQDEMKIQVEIEEYMDNRANELKNRVKRIEL